MKTTQRLHSALTPRGGRQSKTTTRQRKQKGEERLRYHTGIELSERRRAKASTLGLLLFLWSPEISPSYSLSRHFSDFTVPAMQLNPFLSNKKMPSARALHLRAVSHSEEGGNRYSEAWPKNKLKDVAYILILLHQSTFVLIRS